MFFSAQEEGETFVKTMSDCWVVGRKSDQREFYVILNQKNANLIEINGEFKETVEGIGMRMEGGGLICYVFCREVG